MTNPAVGSSVPRSLGERVMALAPATALALVMVIAGVWLNERRPIWYDEILTLELLRAESTGQMLDWIKSGMDSAPPLYHLLARGWSSVFHGDVAAIRLLSSILLGAAVFIYCRLLGQVFGVLPGAFACSATLLTSPLLLRQSAEVRFYGLLMLLSVLALSMAVDRLATNRTGPWRTIALTVVLAALSQTHIYGVVYAGVIGCVVWLVSALRGPSTLAGAVPLAGAMLSFAAYVPWLRSQMLDGARSWIPSPGVTDLVRSFGFGNDWFLLALVLGPLLALIAGSPTEARAAVPPAMDLPASQESAATRARSCTLLFGAGLIAVVPMAFVVSVLVTPILLGRYLLPASLGGGIVLAATIASVGAPLTGTRHRRARLLVWSALTVVFAAVPLLVVLRTEAPATLAAQVLPALERESETLPVLLEDAQDYLELRFHEPRYASRFLYPIDSLTMLGDSADAKLTVEAALWQLKARANTPSAQGVRGFISVLCSGDPVFVLHRRSLNSWYARRVRSSPDFSSVTVAALALHDLIRVSQVNNQSSLCGKSAAMRSVLPTRTPLS